MKETDATKVEIEGHRNAATTALRTLDKTDLNAMLQDPSPEYSRIALTHSQGLLKRTEDAAWQCKFASLCQYCAAQIESTARAIN